MNVDFSYSFLLTSSGARRVAEVSLREAEIEIDSVSANRSLRSQSSRAETFQIKSAGYRSARPAKSDRLLAHLLSKVYQQPVGSIDPNDSDTRKFEVYNDINCHGDHRCKHDNVQPTARLRFGHPVSGDQ
jgi:hypothetical protein